MGKPVRRIDAIGDCCDINCLPEPFRQIILRHMARHTINMLSAAKTADKAGIGVSTLWRDLKEQLFVPPIQISQRRIAWIESEVDALLEAKRLVSRTSLTVDIRKFVAVLVSMTVMEMSDTPTPQVRKRSTNSTLSHGPPG